MDPERILANAQNESREEILTWPRLSNYVDGILHHRRPGGVHRRLFHPDNKSRLSYKQRRKWEKGREI